MLSQCIFFVVDFFRMKESSDENDALPESIQYVYPTDLRKKFEFINRCGELITFVHYFQRALFYSTPMTWSYEKTTIVHRTYGRHSVFLSAPKDDWPVEKLTRHFQTIVDVFHLLYGSWNKILSLHSNDTTDQMFEYLSAALTPIVDPILTDHHDFTHLFTVVDYVPLKKGNQHITLESKHLLDHIESKYSIKYSIFGYDNQVLLTNWTGEKTFYLQFIFKIRKHLDDNLIEYRSHSHIRLHNGVSLFRIFLPEFSSSTPLKIESNFDSFSPLSRSLTQRQFRSIFSSQSESESASENRRSMIFDSPVLSRRSSNRQAMIFPRKESASSDTDASPSNSFEIVPKEIHYTTINDVEPPLPLTDDQKLEFQHQRSRQSTYSEIDPFTATLTRSPTNSPIMFRHVETPDDEEDEDEDDQPVEPRRTTDDDENLLIPRRPEIRLSWKNISEKNDEEEQKEYILYVQRNSRMIFAGILDPTAATQELFDNLWTSVLSHMSQIEMVLQSTSLQNGNKQSSSTVDFQFLDETHLMQLERVPVANQINIRIPSVEVSSLTIEAEAKLRKNEKRRCVILSRGNQSLMGERYMNDRTFYTSVSRSN